MKLQKLIKLVVHTDQEAFDKAVNYFASAPRRAVAPDASFCVYETEDRKQHCVVGALLKLDTPEKHRWAQNASGGVSDLAYCEGEDLGHLEPGQFVIDTNGVDEELLVALQEAHDNRFNWELDVGFVGWSELAEVAEAFGLDTKELDAKRR